MILLLFVLLISLSSVDASRDGSPGSRLSVLITTPPLAGHAYRMLALGEELVRRGHNVTFCTALNWVNLDKKAIGRGMTFLSAGEFPVEEKYLKQIANETVRSNIFLSIPTMLHVFELSIKTTVEYLQQLDLRQWDIIVVDVFLDNTVTCLAQQAGVPVIEVVPRIVYTHLLPEWPFPSGLTLQTDDMTFADRVGEFLTYIMMDIVLRWANPTRLATTNGICDAVFHSHNPQCVEFPCFSLFPIGYEFSRTSLPLVHYVGPLLTKEKTANFSNDLLEWLASKSEEEVVYISMGSVVVQTAEMAQALVNGLQSTRYSAVWSLKKANQFILDGLEINSARIFIADWVPQIQLLQHPAVGMAIVHGGTGGVTEALHNGLPIIVIPFIADQHGNAASVQATGAGIGLKQSQLTAKAIKDSIEAIEMGQHRKEAQKIRKLFIEAGGVDKASDLVELYADIGYQHLVPAYVKYKWSWVQYYNVDVKLLLALLLAGVIYCTAKLFKCCCCCFCRQGSKSKID